LTNRTRRLLLIVGVAGAFLVSFNLLDPWTRDRVEQINYSELIRLANSPDLFQSVPSRPLVLTSSRLRGSYFDPILQAEREFEGIIPHGSQQALAETLVAMGFIVAIEDEARSPWGRFLLTFGLPLIFLAVVVLYTLRRHLNQESKEGGNSIGRSRARLRMTEQKKVTFEDVAGADEAKEELQEVVEVLKDPLRFRRLGGRVPRGVLLVGSPGTGKTLLARALAGEADVPFFSISASEFVEMFVGVGASRVRDLFAVGKRHAPCIIFVDEIDSIGRQRGAGLGSEHDEREHALNQLLSEMDGFETSESVIVIGATNRPDILDPALLRPGRFDRRVVVDLPDARGREGILKVHLRNVPLAEDVEIADLARSTPGFSGAQLENLVNEAAIRSARLNQEVVTMADFLEAKDRSLMGRERRSLAVSARDRTSAAYREAGHVLVAWMLPEADPVRKVTIIPRANALGTTVQVPEEDHHTSTKQQIESAIAIRMARRCAEEIFLGSTTSAVADDLREATKLARQMVCEWGMAEETKHLGLGEEREVVLAGTEVTRYRQCSEQTSARVDVAVRRLVLEGYGKARSILERGRSTVERLAAALQEHGTLDSRQLEDLITRKSPLLATE
jgi:cell division protease FtsH